MYERLLLESGKEFIGRRVSGIGANVVDDSRTITIPVVIPEGVAVLVDVTIPTSFNPGVPFDISVQVRNDGNWADTLFASLTDTDTGEVLKDPDTYTSYTEPGDIWQIFWSVTLSPNKTTDFHGLIEVGHVE